jgi:hypothetical protein
LKNVEVQKEEQVLILDDSQRWKNIEQRNASMSFVDMRKPGIHIILPQTTSSLDDPIY